MNNNEFIFENELGITYPEDPPEILYKNARWDNEYHKKLIDIPEIYLTSPADFNDPYDCLVIPRYDKWPEDDWKKMWRQLVHKEDRSRTKREVEIIVEHLIERYRIDPQGIIDEINRNQDKHFIKNVGVFSLSEIKDGILLWSHYADSHKGFCIGYNAEKIKSCAIEFFRSTNKGSKLINFLKNKYVSEYMDFIPEPTHNDPTAYLLRLVTKFMDWEYEKEWRLAVNQNEPIYDRIVNIPIEAIVEINLGFRITQADRANIIFELKRLNYKGKLYQAKQGRYSYRMIFNEIRL